MSRKGRETWARGSRAHLERAFPSASKAVAPKSKSLNQASNAGFGPAMLEKKVAFFLIFC